MNNRDALLQELGTRGIGCGIHYPVPVHLQQAYAHLGYRRETSRSVKPARTPFLSLPMFPELTDSQLEQVAKEAESACRKPRPVAPDGAKRPGCPHAAENELTGDGVFVVDPTNRPAGR